MSLSGSQRPGWLDEAGQRVRDYTDKYLAQAAELEQGDVPLIPAWTPATSVPPYSRRTATRVDAAARLHHALLGGTRQSYELAILRRLGGSWPCFFESARINRRHTVSAAEYLAQAGFDQFLDLGSGLPYHFAMRDGRRSYGKVEHVHEAVARFQPDAPVVYVDIAPIAVAFLRSSMDDDDNCAYVHGDVRHIQTLLASDQVAGHLDLTRPVAVLAHDVLSWMTLIEARETARGSGTLCRRAAHCRSPTRPTVWASRCPSSRPCAKKQASSTSRGPEDTSRRCSATGPCYRPASCPPGPGHHATDGGRHRATAPGPSPASRSNPTGPPHAPDHAHAQGTGSSMSRTDLVVATGRTGPLKADGPAPHVSRVLDYLSGGSDYNGPDKELAVQLLGVAPRLREEVRAHRRHTTRVVKWLAREGYTQFLDLGCGLPYDPGQDEVLHTHDAARTVHEHVSTVYVDNFGPAHSRAEMSLTHDPGAAAVRADACDVAALLAAAPVRARFDMERPIAALAHGLLEWQDDHQALDLVNGLHAHLPPGSAVSVTHTATSTQDERSVLAERYVYADSGIAYHPRSAGHIRALLGRWTVQSPGVVPTGLWGSGYGDFAQRLPDNASDFRASLAAVALKSA